MPLIAIVSAIFFVPVLVVGMVGLLYFGLRGLTDSPERILSDLEACNRKHASILRSVTTEDTRPAAIAELKKLQPKSDAILLRTAKISPLTPQQIEGLKTRRMAAEKLTYERNDLEQNLRKIPFFMDGDLGQLSSIIGTNSYAVTQYFNNGVVQLSTTTEPAAAMFGKQLEYKRHAIQVLSRCTSASDAASVVAELQLLADELNAQVEAAGGVAGGNRIMIRIPNDYKSAEHSLKTMYSATRATVERIPSLPPSLALTLADMDMVLDRCESAAFGDRSSPLGTTSQQRVEKALLAQKGPSDAPTLGSFMPPLGNIAPPSLPIDSSPPPLPPPGYSGPRGPIGAAPGGFGPGGFGPGGNAAPPPGYGLPPGAPPGSFPPANPPPGSVPPGTVPPGYGFPTMDPATSVTIKVTGAKAMDDNAVRDALGKARGASQSSSSRSGDNATFQLQYTGPLAKVVPLITFGTVTKVDDKARTIHVQGK